MKNLPVQPTPGASMSSWAKSAISFSTSNLDLKYFCSLLTYKNLQYLIWKIWFISVRSQKLKALALPFTYVMLAQSTLISYHTEPFVNTEVGCTIEDFGRNNAINVSYGCKNRYKNKVFNLVRHLVVILWIKLITLVFTLDGSTGGESGIGSMASGTPNKKRRKISSKNHRTWIKQLSLLLLLSFLELKSFETCI